MAETDIVKTTVELDVLASATPGGCLIGTLDEDNKLAKTSITSLKSFQTQKVVVAKASSSANPTVVKIFDSSVTGWSFDFFIIVATRPLLMQLTAASGSAQEQLFTVHLAKGVPFILGSSKAQDNTQTDDLAATGAETTIGKITLGNTDTTNDVQAEFFIGSLS